tara:strand:+ start:1438 stop:2442 length:1005 start_codon:yes stop_codon:yes gene_type:complete
MTIQQMLLGAGKISLPPMALTHTEYYNIDGVTITDTTNVINPNNNQQATSIMTKLLTSTTAAGSSVVTDYWGSIPIIGSTETSGARLVVLTLALREAGNSEDAYSNDDVNLLLPNQYLTKIEQLFDGVGSGPNGTGRIKVELKIGNGSYTNFTFGGMYAASEFNTISVWYAFMDLQGSANTGFTAKITNGLFHEQAENYKIGNMALSAIILDNVSQVLYTQSQSTGNTDTTINQTSNLNLAAQTGTSATKILRIVAANGSNISSDVLDYNKGGSEPSYTTFMEGDNGTDERHFAAYHFGDHSGSSIVNMTGDFGDGSTDANDGMAGMGIMFGLN